MTNDTEIPYNPFKLLVKSRKFWLAILDAFIGSLSLTLTWFLAPDKVMSVMTLFGLWQPVVLILIGSIAAEDIALSKATAEMYKADQDIIIAKTTQDNLSKPPSIVIVNSDPVVPVVPDLDTINEYLNDKIAPRAEEPKG